MGDVWYAAFALLTLLGIVNAVVLVAVMRQVGVLHQRVSPIGAGRFGGPTVGDRFPRLDFAAVGGGAPPELSGITVLGYVSPNCGVCELLPPIFEGYTRSRASGDVIALATDAPLARIVQ